MYILFIYIIYNYQNLDLINQTKKGVRIIKNSIDEEYDNKFGSLHIPYKQYNNQILSALQNPVTSEGDPLLAKQNEFLFNSSNTAASISDPKRIFLTRKLMNKNDQQDYLLH
ncbi:hypothetical protein NUSPORA_02315 [Nucleospora cyclopteri]